MNEPREERRFEPRLAIGVFLAVFGIAVMLAALLDMPAADRVINLVSGSVILLVGLAFWFMGRRKTRAKNPE